MCREGPSLLKTHWHLSHPKWPKSLCFASFAHFSENFFENFRKILALFRVAQKCHLGPGASQRDPVISPDLLVRFLIKNIRKKKKENGRGGKTGAGTGKNWKKKNKKIKFDRAKHENFRDFLRARFWPENSRRVACREISTSKFFRKSRKIFEKFRNSKLAEVPLKLRPSPHFDPRPRPNLRPRPQKPAYFGHFWIKASKSALAWDQPAYCLPFFRKKEDLKKWPFFGHFWTSQ